MVPNADRDGVIPINQATYLMSNMVAQAPDNNQGPWAALEGDLRLLADAGNELFVISGPEGTGGTGFNGFATTIAGGHVTVPAWTWKAALVLADGPGDPLSRVTCTTRVITVRMPNVQGIREDDWHNYLTSVDDIESHTGYDLFSNLPASIQRCIEGGVDGQDADGDQVPNGGDNCPLAPNADQADFNDDGVGDACTVKQNQTITFPVIGGHTYGDPDFPVSATASSGLEVTLSIASGPATLAGSMIHVTGVGTVAVLATQAGNPLYNPAPDVVRTFNVEKATATVVVNGFTGEYDGLPHGASGTARGVDGEDLTSLLDLGASFSDVPGGTAYWSFAGNANYAAASGSASIVIVDTTAPAITSVAASPDTIWPPDHKMVPVSIAVSASDLTGTATCSINGVSSNEPDPGSWSVSGPLALQLKASRNGNGSGRVYTITVVCRDASGNTTSATTTVYVPHDQGQ
jgi:hypothetical protein